MTRVYAQTGPHSWSFVTLREPPKRSDLPVPHVISDIMEPTEQVDGKFYTSKRAFRAVGRALGLTEVGNEKPKPRKRLRPDGNAIATSVKKAIEKYQSS